MRGLPQGVSIPLAPKERTWRKERTFETRLDLSDVDAALVRRLCDINGCAVLLLAAPVREGEYCNEFWNWAGGGRRWEGGHLLDGISTKATNVERTLDVYPFEGVHITEEDLVHVELDQDRTQDRVRVGCVGE